MAAAFNSVAYPNSSQNASIRPKPARYIRRMDIDLAPPPSLATVRVVHENLAAPPDYFLRGDFHLLDLRLTPRPLNACGCYLDDWGPRRFERLGDILFVPAGHRLHVRGDSGGSQNSIQCVLRGNEIGAWTGAEIEWNQARLQASLDISNLTIRHLLRRLAAEARLPGPGSSYLCGFLAGQLVIELGRHFEAIGDLPISGGLAGWRLRLIDERLRDVHAPPALGELAALCRISVRQLTRGFRASRGCSIGDTIVQNRIENAKRLLDADHCVKAVARAVGFSSHAGFVHAFRRCTGLSPLQFRRRVLGARLEKQETIPDLARSRCNGE